MFGSKTRKLSRLQKKYRSLALELAEHKALIQTVEHQIKKHCPNWKPYPEEGTA